MCRRFDRLECLDVGKYVQMSNELLASTEGNRETVRSLSNNADALSTRPGA